MSSTRSRAVAVAVVLVVIAGTIAAFLLDDTVMHWAAQRSKTESNIGSAVSRYGQWHYLILVAICVGVIARSAGRSYLLRVVVAMMIAATAAGLTADVIRLMSGRTRPSAPVPQGWYGMKDDSGWLLGRYHYSAFPSAHTATITGYVGVIWLAYRRRGAPFLLLSVLMGWARIVVNAHHLSDVWVAGIVGMAGACWTWYWLMPRWTWLEQRTQ